MARTNYLPIFNHYVYSDLDLWHITLDQGHDIPLGPGQQSCEILFKSTKRIRSYDSDGQRHNIRPVWRRVYKNLTYEFLENVICATFTKGDNPSLMFFKCKKVSF
jgi:hypothetical protein